MKDYYDIKSWNGKADQFFRLFGEKKKEALTAGGMVELKADPLRLYALLKHFISPVPNGLYTMLIKGMPLENMIWWDFVLECEIGFIHIWRTNVMLEATCSIPSEHKFELNKFIHSNLRTYAIEIQKVKDDFEKHSVYVNHYKSYKECVDYLWKEIKQMDLTPPKNKKNIYIDSEEHALHVKAVSDFVNNSVKFHTLGKSLVLNAAFAIESYLNLFIRAGATQELRGYPDVLKKHLNTSFSDRLKNLKFYSVVLLKDAKLDHVSIKDAIELMTLRNKYVHYDESSEHNKLSDVFFDGPFPLYPISKYSSIVDSCFQIYHRPDLKTVKKAESTLRAFVNYIESLVDPRYKDEFRFLLKQNPIGFNELKRVYSSIYPDHAFDFFLQLKSEKK